MTSFQTQIQIVKLLQYNSLENQYYDVISVVQIETTNINGYPLSYISVITYWPATAWSWGAILTCSPSIIVILALRFRRLLWYVMYSIFIKVCYYDENKEIHKH